MPHFEKRLSRLYVPGLSPFALLTWVLEPEEELPFVIQGFSVFVFQFIFQLQRYNTAHNNTFTLYL